MPLRSAETVDVAPAEEILRESGGIGPGDLIPLLQRLQDAYGYLPAEVLEFVSAETGLPTSRMYGVITFYALFHLEPRGRHTVRVCRGTACHVRGSKAVIDATQNTLGIDDGETGEDGMFSFETVACLGACALSPVVVVDGTYRGSVTPERAQEMLRAIMADESAEGVPR